MGEAPSSFIFTLMKQRTKTRIGFSILISLFIGGIAALQYFEPNFFPTLAENWLLLLVVSIYGLCVGLGIPTLNHGQKTGNKWIKWLGYVMCAIPTLTVLFALGFGAVVLAIHEPIKFSIAVVVAVLVVFALILIDPR